MQAPHFQPATGDAGARDAGQQALLAERARLVRLCAHLTGDPDRAEDLAQEALLIAQTREADLRRLDRRWPWLAGIARHLSVDWVGRRRRERARLARPAHPSRTISMSSWNWSGPSWRRCSTARWRCCPQRPAACWSSD